MKWLITGSVGILALLISAFSVMYGREIVKALEKNEDEPEISSLKDWEKKISSKNLTGISVIVIIDLIGSSLELTRRGTGYVAALHLITLLTLSAVAVIDLMCKRIPNTVVLAYLIVGCVTLVIRDVSTSVPIGKVVLRVGINFLLLFAILFLTAKLSKGGIGIGDVKLLSVMGLMLGILEVMFVLIVSMVMCMIFAGAMLITHKKTMKDTLPFGPFIYSGFAILMLVGII